MNSTGKQAGRPEAALYGQPLPSWLVFRKRWGRGGQGPPGWLRGVSRLALLSWEAFLSSEREVSTSSLLSASSVLALCCQHESFLSIVLPGF